MTLDELKKELARSGVQFASLSFDSGNFFIGLARRQDIAERGVYAARLGCLTVSEITRFSADDIARALRALQDVLDTCTPADRR